MEAYTYRRISVLISLAFIVLLLFKPAHIYAKRPNISDSLTAVLKKTGIDTSRVNVLSRLSEQLMHTYPDSAMHFAKKALDISKKLKYKEGEALCLKNLGTIHYIKGNFIDALEKLQKSLKIYTEINPENKARVSLLQRIGVIYSITGNNAKAVEIFFKVINIYEEEHDTVGMANTYNNIGIVYERENNFEKSLEYYMKSINLRKAIGDVKRIALAYNNIGIIYSRQKKYDIALDSFFKALNYSEKASDKRTLAITLGNIGNVYEALKQYSKSLEYQYRSLEIKKDIGNNKSIAHAIYNISSVKNEMGLYEEALSNFQVSLNHAQKAGDKFLLRDIYRAFMNIYSKTGNYSLALENGYKFFKVNKILNNQINSRKINDLQLKYDKSNRKEEIEYLKQQEEVRAVKLQNDSLFLGALFVGIIIILVFFIFIFKSYRQRYKLNKNLINQKTEIHQQKEEILSQRNNLEELYNELNHRKEEIQTQHDIIDKKNQYITDSITYAKFIQDAILPQSQQIQKIIPESFIYFEPKDILSGDFYWIEKKDHYIYIAIVDSSGHGIPGAFISIIGNNLLNQAVFDKQFNSPENILDFLNKGLYKALKEHYNEFIIESGMDIAVLRYDTLNYDLTYTGAHNPIYLIRDKELIQYKSTAYPLGLSLEEEEIDVQEQTIKIQPGDTIYLYSDGYTDQFGGPQNKKFMYKRLRELLINIHDQPCNIQKNQLVHIFKDWKGDNEQVDDVLFIGMKL